MYIGYGQAELYVYLNRTLGDVMHARVCAMQRFICHWLTVTAAGLLIVLCPITVNSDAQPLASASTAENVIIWYEYDLPPISIVSGVDAGTGINNLVQQRLNKTLPGYQHQKRVANFSRITEAMRNTTQTALCVGFQKTPERETVMLFSQPFTIALSPSAIVLKSRAAEFRQLLNKDGQLSLETMLATGNMRIGVASGRSHSEDINQVLTKYKDNPKVVKRYGTDISVGLLEMLAVKRFDLTIMFPEEAQYMAKSLERKIEFVSFPISEAPRFTLVHVVAPRTAWGESMIATVNPVILQFRNTEQFHREREQWMDPEARKRYRKLVRDTLP